MENIWSDVDINLNLQNNGDILKDTDTEAIKNSLTNIIQTMKGSRRMLPGFAANLQSYLFEPISETTAYVIGNELLSAIQKWENRIKVDSIDIDAQPNNSLYKVTVNFTVIETNIKESYTYILKQM